MNRFHSDVCLSLILMLEQELKESIYFLATCTLVASNSRCAILVSQLQTNSYNFD